WVWPACSDAANRLRGAMLDALATIWLITHARQIWPNTFQTNDRSGCFRLTYMLGRLAAWPLAETMNNMQHTKRSRHITTTVCLALLSCVMSPFLSGCRTTHGAQLVSAGQPIVSRFP